ncbi:DUF2285 domain-containing protein [Blastomonas sp. AAP53]|uniref:DNA -binding domain-containing protein n=1 Tax=Blastomonas sp. AAP53 TaxID=1248760 RepID=UPI00187BF163|nr:DUF2285 domain-containing protein [Blastomonas sp. AAP53]
MATDHVSGRFHHLVLTRKEQRLRLSVCFTQDSASEIIILANDRLLGIRTRAAAAYANACQHLDARHAALFAPGEYQRAYLIRLLLIEDALAAGATSRDIAYRIVFPRHHPLSGATWKGSSEHRHCWRLISKARALKNGGYRHLLCRC